MQFSDLEVGQTIESKQWRVVSQDMIQQFAEATGDHQWIHLDQVRCELESPFQTTIAHGFLTSSLMPKSFADLVSVDPKKYTMLNYGVDALRFLEPVRSGDKVKYAFTLSSIEQKPLGRLYKVDASVAIDHRDKPAMVGTFLMLLIANQG